jgi:hypothetical protein
VTDRDSLSAVFRTGKRAFLLNPPAAPSTDTDVVENSTVRAIATALEGSGLEKLVLESTYGAQPGERCGDLNVLYNFEQLLQAQPVPVTVQRAAYYMSNWDGMVAPARQGVLPSMFPEDFILPPPSCASPRRRRESTTSRDRSVGRSEMWRRPSPMRSTGRCGWRSRRETNGSRPIGTWDSPTPGRDPMHA